MPNDTVNEKKTTQLISIDEFNLKDLFPEETRKNRFYELILKYKKLLSASLKHINELEKDNRHLKKINDETIKENKTLHDVMMGKL